MRLQISLFFRNKQTAGSKGQRAGRLENRILVFSASEAKNKKLTFRKND
jgi:hypothetical protein